MPFQKSTQTATAGDRWTTTLERPTKIDLDLIERRSIEAQSVSIWARRGPRPYRDTRNNGATVTPAVGYIRYVHAEQ